MENIPFALYFSQTSTNVISLILAIAAARFVKTHQEVITVPVKKDSNYTRTVTNVKVSDTFLWCLLDVKERSHKYFFGENIIPWSTTKTVIHTNCPRRGGTLGVPGCIHTRAKNIC